MRAITLFFILWIYPEIQAQTVLGGQDKWLLRGLPAFSNAAWLPWQTSMPKFAASTELLYSMPQIQEHAFVALIKPDWGLGASSSGMGGWRVQQLQAFGATKISTASLGAKLSAVQYQIEGLAPIPLYLLADFGAVLPLNKHLKLDATISRIPIGKPALSANDMQARVLIWGEASERLTLNAGGTMQGMNSLQLLAACTYKPKKEISLVGNLQTSPMRLSLGAVLHKNTLSVGVFAQRHSILGISPCMTLAYNGKKSGPKKK